MNYDALPQFVLSKPLVLDEADTSESSVGHHPDQIAPVTALRAEINAR